MSAATSAGSRAAGAHSAWPASTAPRQRITQRYTSGNEIHPWRRHGLDYRASVLSASDRCRLGQLCLAQKGMCMLAPWHGMTWRAIGHILVVNAEIRRETRTMASLLVVACLWRRWRSTPILRARAPELSVALVAGTATGKWEKCRRRRKLNRALGARAALAPKGRDTRSSG